MKDIQTVVNAFLSKSNQYEIAKNILKKTIIDHYLDQLQKLEDFLLIYSIALYQDKDKVENHFHNLCLDATLQELQEVLNNNQILPLLKAQVNLHFEELRIRNNEKKPLWADETDHEPNITRSLLNEIE